MAGSQTDITQRKVAEEQLLHDAFHDALTGLPNRALFIDRLRPRDRARQAAGASYRFAVLFLDLDGFKVVNDSLGPRGRRPAPDRDRPRGSSAASAPGDTVARLGGDEFAILLDDIGDVGDAVARRRPRSTRTSPAPFRLGGHEVFTTASIGIALSGAGLRARRRTCSATPTRRCTAPRRGARRGYVVFDQAMHTRVVTRLQLETDLRRGHRARRVPRPLPADRLAPNRPDRRLRGAGPLAAPRARARLARRTSSRWPRRPG